MHLLIRFIPTRVGYTSKFQHSERFRPVHPHSRGVYAARKLDFWEAFGSSPLAWGILPRFLDYPLACKVHPHSRGVYTTKASLIELSTRFIPTRVGYTARAIASHLQKSGSSPLAWGIPPSPYFSPPPTRFIPTRVGYTRFPSAHPHNVFWFIPTRVGYTFSSNVATPPISGSSPLAWGIRH